MIEVSARNLFDMRGSGIGSRALLVDAAAATVAVVAANLYMGTYPVQVRDKEGTLKQIT